MGEYSGICRKKTGAEIIKQLTKEMQIMDVLWASDVPLSRSDLLEKSEQKSWKDSSVHILLNGLLQKNAIREAGFVKRSKTYGRTFEPTLTREEYFATTIYSHTNKPRIVELFENRRGVLLFPCRKTVHRTEYSCGF